MLHHTLYPSTNNSKKWITFVHGAGGSSSIWFNQVRFFKSYFNVLLIDLRGHGKSAAYPIGTQYTFNKTIEDLIDFLDYNKINNSHFVGISLGSIMIQKMLFKYQSRVEKIGLGGAILNLNFQSRVLMFFGNLTQSILPFIWIYTFFAYVIMPYRNHRKSRTLFIREAKKLSQNEFKRWYKLTKKILPLLEKIRSYKVKTPVLYIMGKEDYMFLPFVKEMVQAHESSSLITLSDSGHVVNIDQPEQFNNNLLTFLLKD